MRDEIVEYRGAMSEKQRADFGMLVAINVAVDTAMRKVFDGCYSPSSDCERGDCECTDKALTVAHAAWQSAKAFYESRIPGLEGVMAGTAIIARIDALRMAETQARAACLMPPDGGSPTDFECDIAARCGDIIRELADRAMIEAANPTGDK
jgi:hypothetical protein